MTTRRTFVLAAALAFTVVFAVHFLNFPGSVPRFSEVSRGGVLLDQSPSFTVNETYKRISEYGEVGRKEYVFRNLTVDLMLPLSLLPFLFLLMRSAVSSFPHRMMQFLLLSLPFAYVIFDFIENGVVLVLLNKYPERMTVLTGILPYVTSVKRLASLLALFLPVAILGLRFLRRKRKQSRN